MNYLYIFFGLCFCQQIFAGVTIKGTRIIFPSNQMTVTVQLNNPVDEPALIQAWLDDGDPLVMPEAGKIPFIVTPPVIEMAPKKGQMLRLISNGTESLPQDRETMYWFNILDIPAISAEHQNQNRLNISIRSRIKLFYRPNKLIMSQEKAFNSVRISSTLQKDYLILENPSPYYINILNIEFKKTQNKSEDNEAVTLSPFSTEKIKLKNAFVPDQLGLNIINDYGGTQTYLVKVEEIE